MLRSLLSALEELTLLVLPHGGQRTARRNAWRAATDLHVTAGYRWVDQITLSGLAPDPGPAPPTPAAGPAAGALADPRIVPARSRATASASS